MRRLRTLLAPLAALVLLVGGVSVRAQRSLYSQDQISQMVAPIALYPDALVSQVLMAATYPDQVQDADAWVRANPGLSGRQLDDALSTATWDPSIIALCKFPTVLDRMADNIKWTTDLGNAFLNQRSDVMGAVQTLRQAAYREGHLATTPQQRVEVQGQTIVIQPAVPDVVYVPTYDPVVVYGPYWSYPTYYYPAVWAPWPGYAFVNGFAWGIGFAVGNIFFGGCDWYNHDVWVNNTVIVNNPIYHGCHYYQNGDWHGYGRQPWHRYDGGWNYARGGGAPYGGRDHGTVRGVTPGSPAMRGQGMEQARLQERRGYTSGPAEHVPSGRVDRGASRPAAHGPAGWTGRTYGSPGVQSPAQRSRPEYGRPGTQGPAERSRPGYGGPAAHGPAGWNGAPGTRSQNWNTEPRGRSEYGRPAAHGPTGWTDRSYGSPGRQAPADRTRPGTTRPGGQGPSGYSRPEYSRPRAQGPTGWAGPSQGRSWNPGPAAPSRPEYTRPAPRGPSGFGGRIAPSPSYRPSAPSYRPSAPSYRPSAPSYRPSAPSFGGRAGGRVAVPHGGGRIGRR